MRNTKKVVWLAVLALVISAAAAAQHDHKAMTSQAQSKSGSEEMIKSCQKHGSETAAALDKLDKTIASGRQSDDPAKMKAALNEAQTQLAEARHHMSMCPMMSGAPMQHGNMQHMDHMQGMSDQSQQ